MRLALKKVKNSTNSTKKKQIHKNENILCYGNIFREKQNCVVCNRQHFHHRHEQKGEIGGKIKLIMLGIRLH